MTTLPTHRTTSVFIDGKRVDRPQTQEEREWGEIEQNYEPDMSDDNEE